MDMAMVMAIIKIMEGKLNKFIKRKEKYNIQNYCMTILFYRKLFY